MLLASNSILASLKVKLGNLPGIRNEAKPFLLSLDETEVMNFTQSNLLYKSISHLEEDIPVDILNPEAAM